MSDENLTYNHDVFLKFLKIIFSPHDATTLGSEPTSEGLSPLVLVKCKKKDGGEESVFLKEFEMAVISDSKLFNSFLDRFRTQVYSVDDNIIDLDEINYEEVRKMLVNGVSETSNPNEIVEVHISNLEFDPQNPRFARFFDLDSQPEDDVIERMIASENIQELMGSIAEQDYFIGEPLMVAEQEDSDKYIVVEGNRRLAALKLLNGNIQPARKLASIDRIREEAKYTPEAVPCQVFKQRKDLLRYLGYRHITGAKRWDSLSKAKYIKQLKESFYDGIELDEMSKSIAKEIGSRKDYVAQMLTGLSVYENAKEHDFYGLQHVKEENIEFSLLTTAISYSNIAQYIGLESRTDIDAEKLDIENAKNVFLWLYSQNPETGRTVLGESRNLKKLAAITAHPEAVEVLQETSDLSRAFIHTEGPLEVFEDLLNNSFNSLKEAQNISYNLESVHENHWELADKISERAEDLASRINKILRKKRRGGDDE